MPAKTPPETISAALSMYSRGMSSTEVSQALNISASTVAAAARNKGIIRNISDAKKLSNKKKLPNIKTIDKNRIYGKHESGEKTCSNCKQSFPATLEFFYKRKRENGKAYFSSKCKACVIRAINKYREENPAAVKASLAKSRATHGHKHNKQKALRRLFDKDVDERKKRKNKEWHDNNREHLLIYRAAYRKEYKEEITKRDNAWRKANANRARASRANRKARVKGADGSFSPKDIEEKLLAQNGACFWCGEQVTAFHIDHLTPIAKGGTNYPDNLVISCPTCNVSRGAKSQDEFIAYRSFMAENQAAIEERREYMRSAMRRHRKAKRQKIPAEAD